MNNTLNKLVAQVKIDLDVIKPKYSKMKTYIKRKLCNTKGTERSISNNSKDDSKFVSQLKDYEIGEGSGKRGV